MSETSTLEWRQRNRADLTILTPTMPAWLTYYIVIYTATINSIMKHPCQGGRILSRPKMTTSTLRNTMEIMVQVALKLKWTWRGSGGNEFSATAPKQVV